VFRYESSEPKLRKALGLARAMAPARSALRGFRPDVVHAQGAVMPSVERSLYRRTRAAKRVCTVHDVEGHEWRPWLGSLTRFYAGFDALICHSHSSQQRLLRAVPGTPVTVVPHGRYTPLTAAPPDRTGARAALGVADGARVVLAFGFIRPYKGLDLLLDALRLARQREPAIQLLVAGRPLYDIDEVRRAAERDGLPVRWDLRFIPRDEMGRYFAAADVVALPYVDTSDSGVIELAAAFGRPVVAAAAGGLGEAFSRYGHGALVPPRDVAALAGALVAEYEPAAAYDPVDTSWDAVAERTEALYHRLRGSRAAAFATSGAA
jgi:glycosyltransferase involved in cell wall biosynthesis